jgi:hypothetical protein
MSDRTSVNMGIHGAQLPRVKRFRPTEDNGGGFVVLELGDSTVSVGVMFESADQLRAWLNAALAELKPVDASVAT